VPAMRSMVEMLGLLITLLANRLNRNSRNRVKKTKARNLLERLIEYEFENMYKFIV
jgi:hypothetical protein